MISFYIHIPFCIKKCEYCDFLSSPDTSSLPLYISALKREISTFKTNKKIKSIFIGGGTPSAVDSRYIKDIMCCIKDNFVLSDNCEISIETNPGTLDEEKLSSYKTSGINRLSMGIQSFDDRFLKILGRIHDRETAINNFMLAKKYFDNINMDLMFALPQQSTGDWKKTLDTAVSLAPVHISAYSLIIEEGTPFYAKYTPADDDIDREMYYFAKKFLAENGYRQYEISNFAKDGFKCKHNLVYWQGGDYKGFGIGAASLVDAHRTKNTEDIRSYLNGTTIIEDIPLDTDDMMKEFVILGLRCTEGIDSLEFERRFGKNVFAVFGGVFKKYPDLVYINGSNIRLTSKGTDLSNIVFSDII